MVTHSLVDTLDEFLPLVRSPLEAARYPKWLMRPRTLPIPELLSLI